MFAYCFKFSLHAPAEHLLPPAKKEISAFRQSDLKHAGDSEVTAPPWGQALLRALHPSESFACCAHLLPARAPWAGHRSQLCSQSPAVHQKVPTIAFPPPLGCPRARRKPGSAALSLLHSCCDSGSSLGPLLRDTELVPCREHREGGTQESGLEEQLPQPLWLPIPQGKMSPQQRGQEGFCLMEKHQKS